MSNNMVIKRTLYYVEVKNSSPVCVSNGDDGITDNDVIRDYDGKPFIPGSSLSGAFRNHVNDISDDTDDKLFGNTDGETGKMSPLFISDMEFYDHGNIQIRDGVELDDNKTAKTGAEYDYKVIEKYDFEVIDTGQTAGFIMELTVREGDVENDMKSAVSKLLLGLARHDIRLGSKKTRGYGCFDVQRIAVKEFSSKNMLEYAHAYDKSRYSTDKYADAVYRRAKSEKTGITKLKEFLDSMIEGAVLLDDKYIRISVPAKLDGGISIRKYSAKKGEPDYVHITAGGEPVIPGTSMSGVIRHRIQEILDKLGVHKSDSDRIMYAAFGFVNGDSACISSVIFDELVIHNSTAMAVQRNAISRFEGATKKTALFKEQSYFGGNTEINILVRKKVALRDKDEYKVENEDISSAVAGMIVIALKDILNGYLPVGGQTSIGRGLLLGKEDEISISDSDGLTVDGVQSSFGKLVSRLNRKENTDD